MNKQRSAYKTLLPFILGLFLFSCKPTGKDNLIGSQNATADLEETLDDPNNTTDTIRNLSNTEVPTDSTQNRDLNITENPVDSTEIVQNPIEEPEEKKYLYITFDDGPNEGTDYLVNTLRRHEIPTTMFYIGRNVKNNEAKTRELEQDPLFQIANHSHNHAWGRYKRFYSHPQGVLDDFNRAKEVMPYATISRTPGRNMWRVGDIRITDLKPSAAAANLLAKHGYQLVGWDVEWKHSKTTGVRQTAQEMMNEIDYFFNKKISRTKNHVIFLSHDQYFTTPFAKKELEKFLTMIKNRDDIVLKKINEYPAVTPDQAPLHPEELITMSEN